MAKEVKFYISPSKGSNKISSWKDKIEENYGALSAYNINLKNGESIESILLNILKYKGEGMNENQNYFNIKGIYFEHINSLQKNLEKEDSVLKEELDCLKDNAPSSKTVEILLKYGILPGIEFFIPYEKVYRQYDDIMGDNVFKGVNTESLYKKYWDKTFKDINYIPDKKIPFKYSDLRLNVQVLIFSKVKFKLYDVTSFISEINTFVSKKSGGNFNLKIHLFSQSDLEETKGKNFQNNNMNITGYTKALFIQSIFRENDIVFIRYEKLKSEVYLKNKKIKGRYWDMIGLIDSTTLMSDYNSLNISITGRDLIKLIIEDNCFFIPYQWSNNPDTVFGGKSSKICKRLFASGEYNLEFIRSFKSIENSLGFIFSQLTNIEVLSTDCVQFLKDEYENDLSKQYEYVDGERKEKKLVIEGIWGIVNFYVDEKISHYRLADASLKSPEGSTMQQVLKICQEPFVEFLADTFVDKYNFIARRPPFSIKDISNSKFFVIGRDIALDDYLEFSKEIYTVYQLIPQGGCFADNNSIFLSYLPMIVLDEYTRLWGNKLYSQVYNYMNIDVFNQLEDKQQRMIKESFIESLIWLVETNAYLPFSRTGKITIKGDRRIKVGQWIYYEKTNEVFYVDAVNNSASIVNGKPSRVTTLNVSRGLVKDYVKPSKKDDIKFLSAKNASSLNKREVSNMSYADLIDIDLLREGLKELCIKMNKSFTTTTRADFDPSSPEVFKPNTSLVISKVFDFFLSGKQFEGKITPYSLYYYGIGEDGGGNGIIEGIGNLDNGKSKKGYNLSINVTSSSGYSYDDESNIENEQGKEGRVQDKVPASNKAGLVRRLDGRLIFRIPKD